MDGDLPQPVSKKARKLSSRIENEDKCAQIRINETNIQSSNSDIGNENGRRRGYDVCGKGEIIHSEESSTESDIDTDNLVLNGSFQNDNDLNKSFITRKTKMVRQS